MNPVSKYLLTQCVETRTGHLMVSHSECEEYAIRQVGYNPEYPDLRDLVIHHATMLGIWVL